MPLLGLNLERCDLILQRLDPYLVTGSRPLQFHGDLKFFSTAGDPGDFSWEWQFFNPVKIESIKCYNAHFHYDQLLLIEEIEDPEEGLPAIVSDTF